MSGDCNREWLVRKFGEIRRRLLQALAQMNDEQINWQPNAASNSAAMLIRHIEGNVRERIVKGIHGRGTGREPGAGRAAAAATRAELEVIVNECLQTVIDTVKGISDRQLEMTQSVRGRDRTNLDMLHQCAAHYSEHMGQIFYIAKMCAGDSYISTSI